MCEAPLGVLADQVEALAAADVPVAPLLDLSEDPRLRQVREQDVQQALPVAQRTLISAPRAIMTPSTSESSRRS